MTREKVINLVQAKLARAGIVVKRSEIGAVLDDITTIVGEDAKSNHEVYDFTLGAGYNTIQLPDEILYVKRVLIDETLAEKRPVNEIIEHNNGEVT